jgi:hypothetical protein|tara:strand:+ start:488 stop:871 length:384 start_codon:yes stop_codon:yes gene_type:complete
LLETHFRSQTKNFGEYLIVCERLGKEPDLAKMPMDRNYYPYEVQLAMSIHEVLPDRWDGMSGSYLGKDWSAVGTYLDAYNVESKTIVLYFIKVLDVEYSNIVNENLDKERKKRERKSQANIPVPNIK